MEFHRIRLHGPWQMNWFVGDSESPNGQSSIDATGASLNGTPVLLRLPGEVALSESWRAENHEAIRPTTARVVLVRRFNRPTGLDVNQVMLLGCWSSQPVVSAWLNEQALPVSALNFPQPTSNCFSLSVAALKTYNSVGLVFRLSASDRFRIDQVALGISETGRDFAV